MKILVIAPKNRTVWNFRGDLIREIVGRGHEVLVVGPDMTDVDRIEALGARFTAVAMNKHGINPLKDLRYFIDLRKLIRRERPDVTFGYTIKPTIYGALAAKSEGVKRIVSMVTGVGYLFTSRSVKARILKTAAKMLYRMGMAAADTVIFQNPDDRADFVGTGMVRADKTTIVNGSGVNMERFTPVPLNRRDGEPMRVLCISRALRSKGVEEYIEAARILAERWPGESELTLLGAIDESMSDSIERREVERAVADGVLRYLEERPDVRGAVAESNLMVLASHREGTPRTILEAMAMRRPVVVSDAPGCRQTVSDGVSGLLCQPRSAADLARAIHEMAMKTPAELDAMAQASLDLCRERFDVDSVNAEMLRHLL